ncbi:hypothetical protein [Agrobacterium cavarae]|uniref:hypothetical protein n=1 Tax=Agrobacterium cavarae TaxID=2528239 RepID=UPI0028A58358|nr:hypothetical protein [Agrobacterium cavarae]
MTLFLASFGSAAAELKRTKIGPDPYGQKESLLVNGSTGVFSYIAADGSLQVVELKCASFLGDEATDKGVFSVVMCSNAKRASPLSII